MGVLLEYYRIHVLLRTIMDNYAYHMHVWSVELIDFF